MTDKQTIIDGVDVSECKFLTKTRHCKARISIMDTDTNKCKCFPNCYYKQLKCKAQSEERLVKQVQNICDFINSRQEVFNGIYGNVDEILIDYVERKEQECEELKKDLHQNFKEKDKLHLIIDRLLEASGYDTNTASAEDFEDVYENMRYEQQQLDQLKQALAEIKEIAEYCYDPVDKENDGFWSILQKISEVEND